MTTKDDIRGWLNRGKKQKATHMIVVCDTFSYEDFPVFVSKKEDVTEKIEHYQAAEMSRVMEVYKFSDDLEEQLNIRINWRI